MSHLYVAFGVAEQIVSKYIVTGINGTAVADTTIATTAAGLGRFYPFGVRFVLTSVNTLTVSPTVSVGTNSPNFNNIIPATTLTTLVTANDYLPILLVAVAPSVAASTAIKCRVSVGATAVTYTFAVHLVGDYA